MTTPLFDGYEAPRIDPDLSAGQRLTLRQQANIRVGRHPLTHGPLHIQASRTATRDDLPRQQLTCGTCVFRTLHHWHNQTYPKCVSHDRTFVTHSTATDVRAWWPACPAYLPTSPSAPTQQGVPE